MLTLDTYIFQIDPASLESSSPDYRLIDQSTANWETPISIFHIKATTGAGEPPQVVPKMEDKTRAKVSISDGCFDSYIELYVNGQSHRIGESLKEWPKRVTDEENCDSVIRLKGVDEDLHWRREDNVFTLFHRGEDANVFITTDPEGSGETTLSFHESFANSDLYVPSVIFAFSLYRKEAPNNIHEW